MRINWVEVRQGGGYALRRCDFGDFTLLVGKTGMGKSNILSAIHFFHIFFNDKASADEAFRRRVLRNYAGCEMIISFTDGCCEYVYSVTLAAADADSSYSIEKESLHKSGLPLFTRTAGAVKFLSFDALPRLAADKSLLLIFPEEDICREVLAGFRMVTLYNDEKPEIFSSLWDPLADLYDIYRNDKPLFGEIKDMYSGVFEDVADMAFDESDYGTPVLKVRHEDNNWIDRYDMSSGMLKTLHFIVFLKTAREGAVLLIDEIDNSLGINCLDVIVEELMYTKMIQYVITSHHPYVINNVPPDKWKVVSRNGKEIIVRNAEELGIGAEPHDSFYQLLNALHFEEDAH